MSASSKGRAGGVLPINPAATRKPAAVQKASSRTPGPRLRLVVRRLPPGLTEAEFWESLGTEWQNGSGKVDWFAFKSGKVSRDPSKPSKPGRAYLKVKDQSLLDALSLKIKQASFKDAKNTSSDSCLIGPPSLEFAPYSKVPGGRVRNDGRQGTIDQDQEFIDFLQSLTEPITRPVASGPENGEPKVDRVTTTPLVQFIKEKKANKAKDKEAAAASKGSKKQEGKEAKVKAEPKATVIVKSNASAAEKARVAKATQDAVKAINKSVAAMQTKVTTTTTSKPELKAKEAAPVPAPNPTPKRERERGSASAAARMISRDLGLAPKEPRTPRAPRNANSTASTPSGTPATPTTTKSEAAPKLIPASATPTVIAPAPKPASSAPVTTAPPTGPRNGRTNTPQQSKQSQPTPQRQAKSTPQPSSGAKSAFLKHANPSQGVTEELLRTTFTTFGDITRCEIDKKKGLGYIDFTDTESLKKAMAASPVKVGNGQVTVLENRSPYRKGGAAQQRAGDNNNVSTVSAAQVPSPSVATSATSSPQVTTASVASPAITASNPGAVNPATATSKAESNASDAAVPPSTHGTTADAATSTAPRNSKSGANGGRGNRGAAGGGANSPAGRGGFANRGGRGNSRGGRGGRGPKGGGAAAAAGATTASTTTTTGNSTPAPQPSAAAATASQGTPT